MKFSSLLLPSLLFPTTKHYSVLNKAFTEGEINLNIKEERRSSLYKIKSHFMLFISQLNFVQQKYFNIVYFVTFLF